ncbi:MAG: fibrobacter succinogenes major paralogous domain-containing protein [Chitinophagaceae bacterium]|nr:fibrobacter succinogenes major paralogous domain-containing protein [Chitinophagaceae bacterium]
MKKILLSALLFCSLITNAQVGIGVSVANIEPSAQLEVKSTNKGLLTPRMNEAQKNAINNPAAGLLVYQTDGTSGFYYYDGSAWKQGATDTASLSSRINTKLSLSDTSNMLLAYRTGLNDRVKYTDTSDMLLAYRTGLNNKVNIVDTSNMLLAYRTGLNDRVKYTDTSDMLLAYRTGLNNKLNIVDTLAMLSPYLRQADTASLSERINTKLNSSVIDLGIRTGDIIYWDDNLRKFRILAPGTAGQVLKMSSGTNPVPVWGTDATTSTTAFSPCGTTITDIDGNSYNTVLIGSQCWTKENLRVRKYNNGTAIGFNAEGGSAGFSSTWENSTIGLHAIYASDSTTTPSNRTKYGYLYNWYAAKGIFTTGNIASTDTLNICPEGWHVPTYAEWTTLFTELGGESVAGGMMKSKGTAYWNSPNTGATNESGFLALPGGYRMQNGSFNDIRNSVIFWSDTENDNSSAWCNSLSNSNAFVSRNSSDKRIGACIRCIRN